jgi:hypothetical protein
MCREMTRNFWGTIATVGTALAITGCFTLNVRDEHREAAVVGGLEFTATSLALPQPTIHVRSIHCGGDVAEGDVTLTPPVPLECGDAQLAIAQSEDNIRRLALGRSDSVSVGAMEGPTPVRLKVVMQLRPKPELEERCAVIMTAQRVKGRFLIQAVAHGQVFAEIEDSERPKLGVTFVLKSVAALGADIVTFPFQIPIFLLIWSLPNDM